MTDLSSKSVLVVDRGIFLAFALRLSRGENSFGRVLYFNDWQNQRPSFHELPVGTGYSEIEVVDDFWKRVDDADVVAFPDCYDGSLQKYLRAQGHAVWGSGTGGDLEIYRYYWKQIVQAVGLETNPFIMVKGMVKLREHLEAHDERYVKISRMRGLMETWHHVNYETSRPKLDKLQHQLGPLADETEFIIEEKVESDIEIAGDTYFVGGFPDVALSGVERKDAAYLGIVQPYKNLPKQVQMVNKALAPVLKMADYANFFACELRLKKDGTPIPIDPACRMASPAGEAQLHSWTNFPEIVYGGAHGELVQPEYDKPFVAQAMLFNKDDEREWCAIQVSDEYAEAVHLYFGMKRGHEQFIVPQPAPFDEIGSVTATGDTMEQAIEAVKEIAESIKGDVTARVEAFDDAIGEFELMEKKGMDIEPIAVDA